MNQKDDRFHNIHTVLDNVSWNLHKKGVGTTKCQARAVTKAEEEQLWVSGTIGTHSPVALVNATFFYCGSFLCLRGGDEHRALKFSQFEIKFVEDPSAPGAVIKCLTYTKHGSKNHRGTTHQVYLDNKIVSHYANPSLGERCFVYIIELYMSKLSSKAVQRDFFLL